MKRIPKIMAAALATVALSASLVLAAGAGSPRTADDTLPANCPVSGAPMHMLGGRMAAGPMHGDMMSGGQMNGGMRGASMMNAASPDDEHKGGHGGGHGRVVARGQMASLERI